MHHNCFLFIAFLHIFLYHFHFLLFVTAHFFSHLVIYIFHDNKHQIILVHLYFSYNLGTKLRCTQGLVIPGFVLEAKGSLEVVYGEVSVLGIKPRPPAMRYVDIILNYLLIPKHYFNLSVQ